MSTDITTRKRMTKYKESKTNTNVEIIRWESYMITYIIFALSSNLLRTG